MTIYFLRLETGFDRIKIGYTASSVQKRISQLQTGQPYRLVLIGTIPGERDSERRLHEEFDALNVGGEWFKGSFELIAAIEFLIDGQHPWYFCKHPAFALKRMMQAWYEEFRGHQPEPELELALTSKRMKQVENFLYQIERFNKSSKRDLKRRCGIYGGMIDRTSRAEQGAVTYISAWSRLGTHYQVAT